MSPFTYYVFAQLQFYIIGFMSHRLPLDPKLHGGKLGLLTITLQRRASESTQEIREAVAGEPLMA